MVVVQGQEGRRDKENRDARCKKEKVTLDLSVR